MEAVVTAGADARDARDAVYATGAQVQITRKSYEISLIFASMLMQIKLRFGSQVGAILSKKWPQKLNKEIKEKQKKILSLKVVKTLRIFFVGLGQGRGVRTLGTISSMPVGARTIWLALRAAMVPTVVPTKRRPNCLLQNPSKTHKK